MIKKVDISLSEQARTLIERMPDFDEDDFLNWFCNIRKIVVGGGDLIDYLSYLKKRGGEE